MLALPLGAQLVFLHLYQSVSSLLKKCRLLVLSGWNGLDSLTLVALLSYPLG